MRVTDIRTHDVVQIAAEASLAEAAETETSSARPARTCAIQARWRQAREVDLRP